MKTNTPWAVTWLTWPVLFAFNVSVALRAITYRGNYSTVLTTLLITDVLLLVTLEFLFPVRREWKMTWRSFLRDLKYIIAGGASFAAIDGVFGLVSIRLNTGHTGSITNWPLYLSVPAALLVVEFLNYWQHRWSHELSGSFGSFLWRSHAAHHLPEQVYVLMHPATHPINGFARLGKYGLTAARPERNASDATLPRSRNSPLRYKTALDSWCIPLESLILRELRLTGGATRSTTP